MRPMKPTNFCRSGSRNQQNGSTLVEALVTMFVVAVGLLGSAGLQLASTRYQQTSAMRTLALVEADVIIEKMRVNNAVLTQSNIGLVTTSPETVYVAAEAYADADAVPDDPNCGLAGQSACTAGQAAQRDLREWRQALALNLPGGERLNLSCHRWSGATSQCATRSCDVARKSPA